MSLPPGVRAVIFDLDGVLWHSDRAHAEAYRETFLPLGISVPPYEILAGRRTDEVVASLLGAAGEPTDPTRVAALTAEKQARAYRLLAERPPVDPQAATTLRRLAERLRLALASSASQRSVELFLEVSGTGELFEVVVSGAEVSHAKPDPEIYRTALDRLGLAATAAVAVEDSISGIQAARAAGLAVLGRVGGCSAEELRREHVVAVIHHLDEICPDAAALA